MHTHWNNEILYIASGKGKYLVEGSEYFISGGSVLIMRANEVHMLQADPSAPYERIVIQFSSGLPCAIHSVPASPTLG